MKILEQIEIVMTLYKFDVSHTNFERVLKIGRIVAGIGGDVTFCIHNGIVEYAKFVVDETELEYKIE